MKATGQFTGPTTDTLTQRMHFTMCKMLLFLLMKGKENKGAQSDETGRSHITKAPTKLETLPSKQQACQITSRRAQLEKELTSVPARTPPTLKRPRKQSGKQVGDPRVNHLSNSEDELPRPKEGRDELVRES